MTGRRSPETPAGAGTRGETTRRRGAAVPPWIAAALVVALPALAAAGFRYRAHGDWNAFHLLLSAFCSINLMICYWEVCLFLERGRIASRLRYWRRWRDETGRTPALAFLSTPVPLRRILAPAVWVDVWGAYAVVDESYVDRRTFGFNADIVNGLFTPAPTLILLVAYTFDFLPAIVAGVLGIMLYWQWTYVTSVYLVSFFVAGRHRHVSRSELYIYVWGMNSPWVLCPLLGLYVSVRLLVEGDYRVLGY